MGCPPYSSVTTICNQERELGIQLQPIRYGFEDNRYEFARIGFRDCFLYKLKDERFIGIHEESVVMDLLPDNTWPGPDGHTFISASCFAWIPSIQKWLLYSTDKKAWHFDEFAYTMSHISLVLRASAVFNVHPYAFKKNIGNHAIRIMYMVVMPNGKVYGIEWGHGYPIHEIDTLTGDTTRLNVTSGDGYRIHGVTTFPFSKSNTRILGLGVNNALTEWHFLLIDLTTNIIRKLGKGILAKFFFFVLIQINIKKY